ncbi:hypothetical protein AN643_00600 [Candidatus Epulonipiscioides saccharophilum]|nr:hypothetical protein AN643_00600 [Epulopiscium sp. SCG-B10WGA-EpuloB]
MRGSGPAPLPGHRRELKNLLAKLTKGPGNLELSQNCGEVVLLHFQGHTWELKKSASQCRFALLLYPSASRPPSSRGRLKCTLPCNVVKSERLVRSDELRGQVARTLS